MTLIQAALAQSRTLAAFQDTLALVQDKSKQYDAAIASAHEAMRLEAWNLQWRINLAKIYLDAGRRQEAQRVLSEIDSLKPAGRELPEQLKRQIQSLHDEVAKIS
jgi:predicted Zn-dependent protease